jgi:hypothetical protein
MVASELHSQVEVFDRPEAFFQGADGVKQVGDEQAIDDESCSV